MKYFTKSFLYYQQGHKSLIRAKLALVKLNILLAQNSAI